MRRWDRPNRRFGLLTAVQAETLAALLKRPHRQRACARLGLTPAAFHARAFKLMELGLLRCFWDEFEITSAGREALRQAEGAGWRSRARPRPLRWLRSDNLDLVQGPAAMRAAHPEGLSRNQAR